ncbi:NLR family CARD domain-containing protein 4-like [Branchiostoma floridae]|uniref:NLR family CARD domain-containing protein 4-like n=1 Tax=Branchiostoma floridae TaxID=7739 RepID=A0A9J7MLS7_BRAFL|nr:NLR family CARD domain-containing protein 4-like [Branchiostoma floridae]
MAEAQPSSHTGLAGVRQYFFIVKEEVSSDWKDLAFHLGFERADTDNIAGRNRDDKSRCMDLLEEWLKRNGERATIEVLKEALSEAMLQSTVDSLEKITIRAPDMQRPSSIQQTSKEENGRQPEQGLQIKGKMCLIPDVFQEAVKGFYELRLAKFKPLIWNDNFTLNLVDIFTELELIGTRQQRQNEQRRKLHSLDDLFKTDITGLSTAPRCILIEGEAGGGKTTFLSKEALDAVSQKTELGRRHDLVLLIRLREVREGETMEEMVWDQCVPETTEGVDAQSIRAILQRSESRVLFLLDGYDELRPEAREARKAIPKLLSGKIYPKSTIVITSRPSAGVQPYTQPDCYVKIMGFSPDNMEKYVQQYFSITENPGQAEELVTMLKEEHPVVDLIHTPIFLMLVCLLWEEDPNMVSNGTMTGVYSDLLTCLGRKHCKREGVDMPTDDLPTDLVDALMQLGKLALEALLKNETLLDVSDVERTCVNWQLLLNLGVLSLEVSTSKLHPRKQLNFSHRTMQEFLAGRYVAHALMNKDISEMMQLTSIYKALELRNLLLFTCGCDLRAAQIVLNELISLRSQEFVNLRPEHLGKPGWQVPVSDRVWGRAETYRQFVLLCLDILHERKQPDVLEAVSKALPYLVLFQFKNRKRQAAFKYYLENIQTVELPERIILRMVEIDQPCGQYLEETFTSPIPDLRLDLQLAHKPLMSPDQTSRLISGLRNVPALRALDLTSSNLTVSSVKPLVRGFRHIPFLEELDISCNPELGDAGIYVLTYGLSSVPHLAVLSLGLVSMTGWGMLFLAHQVRRLVALRVLDISANGISDTGLGFLIDALPFLTALQELILCNTGIRLRGIRTLVPTLSKLKGLIKLNVSDNAIGDIGLEWLTDILPLLTAMRVLVLNEIGFTDRGMSALVKALPHLVELLVLDVGFNHIGDSGIVSLVETLGQSSRVNRERSLINAPRNNTNLRELHMGNNSRVTGVGLGRVAQLISALPALMKLDMSGYDFPHAYMRDTAAVELAEALPRLPALEWLMIRNICMDPAGFQAVVQAAEEHPERTLWKLK